MLVKSVARSLIAGLPLAEECASRCVETLGRRWRWIVPLSRRFLAAYAGETRPRVQEAVAFLLRDKGWRRAWRKYAVELRIANRFVEKPLMQPVAAAGGWELPSITTIAELAAWFGLSVAELTWFADLRGYGLRGRVATQLEHYQYQAVMKRSGGVRFLEMPKERLKEIQRRILKTIMGGVPVHSAVHGFVRERSIRTFAEPHTGQTVVVRLDLQSFFASIRGVRVQSIFRTMGYPEPVADLLGGLCTNAIPGRVLRELIGQLEIGAARELRMLFERVHLPQGAPTSPALANLCAYRMDCRLAGLAEAAGVRYTRYADDLAFSGDGLARSTETLLARVGAIVLEEGFAVNHRKTRVMRQGGRQRLTGLVVNRHLSVGRAEFDRLKAILHNCGRNGPGAENRDGLSYFRAHLEGRVGFVESMQREKGLRLRELLERIDWE